MRVSTTATQRHKILALLQAQGSATNIELNKICYRYSARLHELRQDGYGITTVAVPGKDRVFNYIYGGRQAQVCERDGCEQSGRDYYISAGVVHVDAVQFSTGRDGSGWIHLCRQHALSDLGVAM